MDCWLDILVFNRSLFLYASLCKIVLFWQWFLAAPFALLFPAWFLFLSYSAFFLVFGLLLDFLVQLILVSIFSLMCIFLFFHPNVFSFYSSFLLHQKLTVWLSSNCCSICSLASLSPVALNCNLFLKKLPTSMPNVHERLNSVDVWALLWFWYTKNPPFVFRG